MISIGIYEAKTNFAKFVERAMKGEKILVTKRGKPAVVISAATETNRNAKEAMERIRELRKQVAKRNKGKILRKGETWRDFIHAGHRY